MATQTLLSDRLAHADRQLELIPYTPRDGAWKSLCSNTPTVSFVQGSLSNAMGNESGIAANWNFGSVATGPETAGTTNMPGLAFPFYGRAVGIRLRRDETYAGSPQLLDFKIDNRLYRGADLRPRYPDGSYAIESVSDWVIATDLDPVTPDGRPHTLEIYAPQSRNSADSSYNVIIFGLLVDRLSGGYQPQPRYGALLAPLGVPVDASLLAASATSVVLDPGGTATSGIKTARALRSIVYANPTAGAITVNVLQGGVVVWSKIIAAGDSQAFDLGRAVMVDPNGSLVLKHVASATGVKYTPIVEW